MRLSWSEGLLLLNGVLVSGVNKTCQAGFRKIHRSQKIGWEDICNWHKAVQQVFRRIETHSEEKATKLIEGLHDVSTAVSLVTRNAEAIISGLSGETDEEKIDSASPALRSLLKSVELLHTRLSLSSIVANPESASFGRKRPTPVYKVFHRMVRLFEELASQRNVGLKMQGSSFAKPDAFDSFDTLALVLIDNAVKYSRASNNVYVVVGDSSDLSVKVAVQSYGPVVSPEIQDKIFQRGFRAKEAEKFSAKGSGLGLYIADIIAQAHAFKIFHRCFDINQSKNTGWNEFSFEV